jgi:hypothetical protein
MVMGICLSRATHEVSMLIRTEPAIEIAATSARNLPSQVEIGFEFLVRKGGLRGLIAEVLTAYSVHAVPKIPV